MNTFNYLLHFLPVSFFLKMERDGARAVLVFAPFHDNLAHRMRLRLSQEVAPHEVISQILLQLVPSEKDSHFSSSLESKASFDLYDYQLFFMNSTDFSALIPFTASAFFAQPSSTMLLVHCSQSCRSVPDGKRSNINGDVRNPPITLSALPCVRTQLLPLPSSSTSEVGSYCLSSESERFLRSNRVMLYIVEQVLSELAIQTGSDCDVTLRTWPFMLTMALQKENTSLDKLDPSVVDQFKKTILLSLSRGKKKLKGFEADN